MNNNSNNNKMGENLPKPLKFIWDIVRTQSGILYIEAPSGVFKTASIYEMAKSLNMNLIDFRLSSVDDIDLGLFPDKTTTENGVFMDFVPPMWAYQANQSPTIILFDELDKADETKYHAALQIFNERKIGYNFSFNKDVYFIACGNPGGRDFGSALKNRIIKLDWEELFTHCDTTLFDYWCENYAKQNIPSFIVDFLNDSKQVFITSQDKIEQLGATDVYPSPRSWTFLGNYVKMKYGMNPKIDKDFIDEIGFISKSYVGNESTLLIEWLKNGNFISSSMIIDDFINIRKDVNVINKLKNTSMLIRLLTNIEKDLTIMNNSHFMENLNGEQIENVIEFMNLIPEDKRVSFIKNIMDYIADNYERDGFEERVAKNILYNTLKSNFKNEYLAIKKPIEDPIKKAEETRKILESQKVATNA
jgi:hypothetical protein